jgi:hypothetical protein
MRYVLVAGRPSDRLEVIAPHEWLDLAWERDAVGAATGELESSLLKRPAWTGVQYAREDVLREWPEAPTPADGKGLRGPRPKKLRKIIERMRAEIQAGRLSADDLHHMKQVELAVRYSCSRDTAAKARRTVLSEFQLRQTPTLDK